MLGSLEDPEASALAEHLASACSTCRAELERALVRCDSISRAVPIVIPPVRLRRRLQQAVAPAPARWRQFWPWLVAVAACVALVAGLVWQQRQSAVINERLPQVRMADQSRESKMLAKLGAPGTVELALTDPKNKAITGKLYAHRTLGMAMVVNSLPAPPAGWFYEI